jgi:predicted nucleic acid-binding protein
MRGLLLDSDVLIELLRGRNAAFRVYFDSFLRRTVPLYYSAVSAAEIGHGAREGENQTIKALLAFCRCLPSDCAIAAEAGEIMRRFRKSHSIGLGDAIIAATAISNDVVLWTRNRKHYPDSRLSFFDPDGEPG